MEAMVLPGVVTAAVLVLAGALKVGRAEQVRETFAVMRVPRALSGPVSVSALPWAEVALGLLVLLAPSPVAVLTTGLAAVLLLVYVVLVARVVLRGEDASCACFGAEEPVGKAAVLRNVLLFATAAAALADAVAGHSTLARLAGLGTAGWAWLVGVAAVAVLAVLVAPTRDRATTTESAAVGLGDTDVPERRGIPFIRVEVDGHSTSLPELAELRPQLLLHLSETCSHCRRVTEVLPEWRRRLPAVDLRALLSGTGGATDLDSPVAAVHDPSHRVASVLGLVLPSAVLLGADALVAAGPVHGADAILDLLAEMEQALDQPPDEASEASAR